MRGWTAGQTGQVWATWTDAEAYRGVHGVHEARIDFRVGGEIEVRFWADRPGGETFVILAIDEPRRLDFAWKDRETCSVTLTIEPRDGGSEVSLLQRCGENPGWIHNVLDGWAWIVDSLESWLETGRGIANDVWSERHGTHEIVEK